MITVMQFNLCGHRCFKDKADIAHATAVSISRRRVEAATLNEICRHQAVTIQKDLALWGQVYQLNHDTTVDVGECEYGNAVLWRSEEYSAKDSRALTTPEGIEPRRIMGVETSFLGVPTTLCSVHLTQGSANSRIELRKKQVQQIAQYIDFWGSKGREVIVGGDFNEEPHAPAMDALYSPAYGHGSAGPCHEAARGFNREGPFESTTDFGKKLDYIFMTNAYTPLGSEATRSGSDHHPYYGFIEGPMRVQ